MTMTPVLFSPELAVGKSRTHPAVSVCIPAYQAERHLKATLDSVLSQDSDDFEVVVIDNNSSDGTAGLLQQFADPRLRCCATRQPFR